MSWIVPYNKLDAQQREFVDNENIDDKNIWIKGFPGSGKSVLLAHTIKKIREERPKASIVVVVYTRSLINMFQEAFSQMGEKVDVITYFQLQKETNNYDYILCDEIQDFKREILESMRSKGRHIVVSGDENQSIYDETVSPSEIRSYLSCKEYELSIIHRLSRDIINVVQKFMPNMSIFSAKLDLTKKSTQVRLCESDDEYEEVKYVMREATKAVNCGTSAAILIPKHEDIVEFVNRALIEKGKPMWELKKNRYGKPDYGDLNEHLEENNIPLQYVGNGYGYSIDESRKITLMTYHSSKGLDFDNVFMPCLNTQLNINNDEELSKKLFMVAMTRSRENLYLTYSGSKHSYLDKFAGICHNINIHDALTNRPSSSSRSSNPFGI